MSLPLDSYDRDTINTYEIVSTYFTKVLYSTLYNKAKAERQAGRAKSITEAYRTNLMNYMDALSTQTKRMMKSIIDGIIQIYIDERILRNVSPTECVKHIAHTFIPEDFREHVDNKGLANTVVKAFHSALGEATGAISKEPFLVIDGREGDEAYENINEIKQIIFNALLKQHDLSYSKFVDSSRRSQEMIPITIVDKLRKKYEEKVVECETLREELNGKATSVPTNEVVEECLKTIREYERQLQQAKHNSMELLKHCKALKARIQELEEQKRVAELMRETSELEPEQHSRQPKPVRESREPPQPKNDEAVKSFHEQLEAIRSQRTDQPNTEDDGADRDGKGEDKSQQSVDLFGIGPDSHKGDDTLVAEDPNLLNGDWNATATPVRQFNFDDDDGEQSD